MAAQHLSSHELAAYMDGRLTRDEKAKVQEHLAECQSCRREATEVAEILEGRRGKRRRLILPMGLAAAAAAILLFTPLVRQPAPPMEGILRGSEEASQREAVQFIEVLAPEPEAVIPRDSLLFRWADVGPGVLYRLTVTDELGDPVWSGETEQTSLALPPEVELQPGMSFIWFLDALLLDGREERSRPLTFAIQP